MFACICLQDYKLGFNGYSSTWKGASATIQKATGHHVYGVVWELDAKDMDSLDRCALSQSSENELTYIQADPVNMHCFTINL